MIRPNTIITGDSLTILRGMDSDSVDMVITDPPYGIDYQSGWKEKNRRFAKISNDKAPFIWWIYDAARVVKPRGGTLFHQMGCSADLHRRAATRRPNCQVGHRVGQKDAWHGRLEGILRAAL